MNIWDEKTCTDLYFFYYQTFSGRKMHFIPGFIAIEMMVFLVVVIPKREQRFQQGSYSPILYVNTTAHAVIFRFHKFIKEQKCLFFSCCMLTRASYGIPISCTVVNPKMELILKIALNASLQDINSMYISITQENSLCLHFNC